MRIDRLDIYYVAMPLIEPWRTAYGSDADIHSVLVKVHSGDYSAWSESTPFFAPTYLNEAAGSAFYLVAEVFGPHVVGKEYDTAQDLNERLAVFKGNSFAKSAIEIAWWNLQSVMAKVPLHKLLGGETREVEVGADFGIQDSIDILLKGIQEKVDAGYPRVKLKAAPGWDYEMLQAVRSAFPKITLHIDCNSGYTLDDLALFKKIDQFGLAFIEQPLHWNDVLDHAELAGQIETPICLDETLHSVKAAEQAIQVNACKYMNIKPGRMGGLANSVRVHDIARDAGIPVWVGGMLESAVGAAVGIELATLPNFTYPADLFPSTRFYSNDLGLPKLELTERKTFLPHTDGMPTPDLDRLEQMTVKKSVVRPK